MVLTTGLSERQVLRVEESDLNYEELVELINEKNKEDERKDRRRKINWISVMATLLSLAAWAIMIGVWFVLDAAAPEREYGWLSFFTVNFDTVPSYRTRWNYNLVYLAYVMMLVSMGSCAISILLGRMRKKRKLDRIHKSVYVIAGITVIGFIVFLINFWDYLFKIVI